MRRESAKTRIDQMLNADKEEMNEVTKESATADFFHVAKEYFEPNGEMFFEIKKTKNNFDVTVRFQASRVKNFTLVK